MNLILFFNIFLNLIFLKTNIVATLKLMITLKRLLYQNWNSFTHLQSTFGKLINGFFLELTLTAPFVNGRTHYLPATNTYVLYIYIGVILNYAELCCCSHSAGMGKVWPAGQNWPATSWSGPRAAPVNTKQNNVVYNNYRCLTNVVFYYYL